MSLSRPLMNVGLRSGERLSFRFLLILLLLVFIGQLFLYGQSFDVRAAGDDWGAPLTEIHRGNDGGLLCFFTDSRQTLRYRPLQSLAMWAIGQVTAIESVWARVRILHFICMAGYLAVLGAWLRILPINRFGAAVAAIFFVCQPTLAAPLAGIDGFSTVTSGLFLWLGVLPLLRWPNRLALSLAIAAICLIVGVLTKEYVFSLVVAAPLTLRIWSTDKPWRKTWIAAFVLGAIGLLLLHARTLAGTQPGGAMVVIQPMRWVLNIIQMFVALIYPGHTAWVVLNPSAGKYLTVAACLLAIVALLAVGVFRWLRQARPTDDVSPPAAARRAIGGSCPDEYRLILFLMLALLVGAFPAFTLGHVSEQYITPMFLPYALLMALAAQGWQSAAKGWRSSVALAGLFLLIVSIVTVVDKVHGLWNVGQRAEIMLKKLDAAYRPQVPGQTVGLVFLWPQIQPQPMYSMFIMNDHCLLSEEAMDWPHPGQRIRIERFLIQDTSQVDRIEPRTMPLFLWDVPSQTFTLVRPASP